MALKLEDYGSQDERRTALRQPTLPMAVEINHSQLGEMTAVMIDISRRGVRLRTGTSFPCGSEISVRPPSKFNLPTLRGRIVRITVHQIHGEEMFDMGIQFPVAEEVRHQWFIKLRDAA